MSSFKHSLIDNKGFYVLDGTHRLFTMPFSSSSSSSSSSYDDDADDNFYDNNNNRDNDNNNNINNNNDNNDNNNDKDLTMWQLSFSGLSESEAKQFKSKCETYSI